MIALTEYKAILLGDRPQIRECEEDGANQISYLVLTVDDLQVVSCMEREYVRAKDVLMVTYKMSDMGVLTFYARIKID